MINSDAFANPCSPVFPGAPAERVTGIEPALSAWEIQLLMSPATMDRRLAPDRAKMLSEAGRTPSPGRC